MVTSLAKNLVVVLIGCHVKIYSPDLNNFLVLVLIEKIYQTLKTGFDKISKHFEVHQNYSAVSCFHFSSWSLEMWSNTVLPI